MEIYNTRDI